MGNAKRAKLQGHGQAFSAGLFIDFFNVSRFCGLMMASSDWLRLPRVIKGIHFDCPPFAGNADGGIILYHVFYLPYMLMHSRVLTDSHMHTPLCGHAQGEPEAYAQRGIEVGLGAVVFTCHSPMPGGFWPGVRMLEEEFDTYIQIVRRTAHAYAGRIDVGLGIESDWFPGYEGWLEELHAREDFDHVLGSIHFFAPEYRERFNTAGDTDAFFRRYFENLVASAKSGLFDTLAHPDLVKNHAPNQWQFDVLRDHIGECLDEIATCGVGMELNTSGLNKRFAEMNPGLQMLEMMAARDIPLVIGSDAHRPERVGADFDHALQLAQSAGYREVQMMWRRHRHPVSIEGVLAHLQDWQNNGHRT